jgi:hypothetical protein
MALRVVSYAAPLSSNGWNGTSAASDLAACSGMGVANSTGVPSAMPRDARCGIAARRLWACGFRVGDAPPAGELQSAAATHARTPSGAPAQPTAEPALRVGQALRLGFSSHFHVAAAPQSAGTPTVVSVPQPACPETRSAGSKDWSLAAELQNGGIPAEASPLVCLEPRLRAAAAQIAGTPAAASPRAAAGQLLVAVEVSVSLWVSPFPGRTHSRETRLEENPHCRLVVIPWSGTNQSG